MRVALPKDVWLSCIVPYLGVLDIAHLAACNRFSWALLKKHPRLVKWKAMHASVDICTYTCAAAREGHCDLVQRFIGTHTREGVNEVFKYAAESGRDDMINILVASGANNWHGAARGSATGGHLGLFKRYIRDRHLTRCDWWLFARVAVKYNRRNIFDFCCPHIVIYPLRAAARYGRNDIIQLSIDTGKCDWNNILIGAARGGNQFLIDCAIANGANDWLHACMAVIKSENRKLIAYFISMETDEKLKNRVWLDLASCAARKYGRPGILNFFHDTIFARIL